MSTLAVVEQILRETKVPMSVRQIVEHAGGRLPTRSKTPDTVVARDLSMDIKRKGEVSIFVRTAPGRYTLRELYLQSLAETQETQTATAVEVQGGEVARTADDTAAEQPTSIVSATLREERAGPLPARSTPAAPSEEQSTSNS